jgi:ubiquinone biosynthesis protein
VSSEKVDEEKFCQDAERLLKRFTAFTDVPLSVGGAFSSVMDALQRHNVRMDPDLTLAIKAVIQAEETAHTLDPDMNLVEACLESTKDLLVETFEPEKVINQLRTQAIRSAKQVVRSIPSLESAIGSWMEQFMRGKLTLHLDGADLSRQIDELDQTISNNVRRIAYALLLAGLIVGAGVASTTTHSDLPFINALAYWIFIGAAFCAGGVIIHALWRWLTGKGV